ncbi:MAG: glycosyltransferase family 4 protein [Chloroflexi bacterium]|nr:glycosyltransferase family 4 protein [Chloroflexota bacterium]MCI0725598.1 glycosyltransferase family 4 protein [Chloroflexota bacterium]
MSVAVATLYETGQYSQWLAQCQITTHNLGLAHKYDLRGLFRLVHLLRTDCFDIVHAHGWPAVLFAALASLLVRRPRYVLTEHSTTNRRRRWRLKSLDRFIYSRVQAVPAVSQAAVRGLVAWLPKVAGKVSLVYNGIDPERVRQGVGTREATRAALGLEDDIPLILLAAGSLEHHKGVDVFLQALAQLIGCPAKEGIDKGPMFKAIIAGDGRLCPALEELAIQLGLHNHVYFLGFRQDVPALMAVTALFVLSSRREGCPMGVLEAMALGLPIVATATGGVPELVVHEEHALLAPADDPTQLSQAMARLLADRPLARRLGRAARQRLEGQFLAQTSADQLVAIYQRIL